MSGIIEKLSCLVTAIGLCKEWLVRRLYDLLRLQLAASRATGMCSLLGRVARDEKDPKLAQKQIHTLTLNKASIYKGLCFSVPVRYMDQQQLFEVEQNCLPGSTAILVSTVYRFGSIFMVWAWSCFFVHADAFP